MAPEIYQGIVAYQSGDSTAAWTLVQKFTPLLKHYAFILHREDGFEDFDTTTYTAEVGYLPVSGLLIAAGIAGFDNDDTDDSDATLRAKYVTQVGAYDMNFEGGVVFADDEIFTLGTDLYLDKTFSVGLGYTDDGEDDSFQIRAKKFFNQQVSLEGSIDFGENVNVYGVRAAYRF